MIDTFKLKYSIMLLTYFCTFDIDIHIEISALFRIDHE